MKVWLDDEREPPEGWEWAKTAAECVELLRTDRVVELSLDHDLGMNEYGTGHDVVCWMEEFMVGEGRIYSLPRAIHVHSANPVGAARMRLGIERLFREWEKDENP